MVKIMKFMLTILFLQTIIAAAIQAMEKEAKIMMPAVPLAEIHATFKETDIPQPRVGTGEITLEDDGSEKIARSAAELSDIIKEQISDIGIETPIPITMTPTIFNKFIASMKAINTITATDARGYAQALNEVLEPILKEMSFDEMIDLLYQSNRLDVRPLTWYIKALFARKLYETSDLKQLATITKSLNSLFDIRDEITQMLESSFPNLVHRKFQIIAPSRALVLKIVPHKGILALVSNATANIYLYNLTKGMMPQQLEKPKKLKTPALYLDMSADGTKAISAYSGKMLRSWDLEKGQMLKEFENRDDITSIALSPDGVRALAALRDHSIWLWDLQTGVSEGWQESTRVRSVRFSSDGNYAIAGLFEYGGFIWNLKSSKIFKRLKYPSGGITSVAISDDKHYALLLSGNHAIAFDLTQEGIELNPYKVLEMTDEALSVAISPDSKYALIGSADSTAIYWNLETGKTAVFKSNGQVTSLAFSPEGEFALIGSWQGEIILRRLSPSLVQTILRMKLNQLGKEKVMQEPYFKEIYEKQKEIY